MNNNQWTRDTFAEGRLFKQVGLYTRAVDKSAPNMYNNKELLRKSLNEVKASKSINMHMSVISQMHPIPHTTKPFSPQDNTSKLNHTMLHHDHKRTSLQLYLEEA